jgi:hypothetical protein
MRSQYASNRFDNPWNFIYIVDEDSGEVTINVSKDMKQIVHDIITKKIVPVAYVRPEMMTKCPDLIPVGFTLNGERYKYTEFETRAGILVFTTRRMLKCVKIFSSLPDTLDQVRDNIIAMY